MVKATDRPRTSRGAVIATDDDFATPAPQPADTGTQTVDHTADEAVTSTPPRATRTAQRVPTRKTTYALPLELDARLNALVNSSKLGGNPPNSDVKAAVVERAIRAEVERLEQEHHKGKPWQLLAKDLEALHRSS